MGLGKAPGNVAEKPQGEGKAVSMLAAGHFEERSKSLTTGGTKGQGKPLRCHAAAAFFWIEGSMELRAAVAAAGCTGPSSGLRFVRMTSGGGRSEERRRGEEGR